MSVTADEQYASQERTFAFVDLAGFTALTEVHGDALAVGQIDRFVSLTRAALADGDELVKTLGDAVMLSFPSPPAALKAVAGLLDRCNDVDGFPVPRTGIHHGPALQRDADWFGATINLAARVTAQAHGGQTLATQRVAIAARAQQIAVTDLGCFSLRNIAEPVELYELALSAPSVSTSVDPVCRMQVRHEAAAGRLRHEHQDFWFCSLACIRSFVDQPAYYVAAAGSG